MKRVSVLFLFVFFVVGSLSGQDPAVVGANVYKCVMENERVRVCEITFKPGASVAVHSHPGHVVYVIAGGRLRITPAGGKSEEFDFKPGMAMWLDAAVHSAVNVGTTEIRAVVVEVRHADPVASAILDMERDWAAAMTSGDFDRAESYMADDWMLTDPMGTRLTKAQASSELRSGAMKFESMVPSDIKVRVYGDTAIVNGRSTDKGTWNGKDISGEYAFTDVFVKRDGKWKAVSTNVTRVVPMP